MKRALNITASELRGILLVFIGLCALTYYYSWWFKQGEMTSWWMILTFIIASFYGIFQLVSAWIVYLSTHHRPPAPSANPETLSVDVFITAFDEDIEMAERSLSAACNMTGEHKTWLLDDGDNPELEQLAYRLGAGYLTRVGNADMKAGNVNAALTQTSADVVVIFDIDHIPQPDFLEKTLRCFADPKVGFVQVMPTFYNHRNNGWVARAATETSLDFYNPTSIGMDAFNSVTKMGTNSIIRRTALESIGGYQAGLAEDLATSIALHSAGWHSRYVAEPLAPGLAPPDLSAWFTQQMKWSRGVFEVLLADFPRLFGSLTWGQRLAYAVRTTKYWIGPVIFIHLLFLIGTLFSQSAEARLNLQNYFLHFIPLAVMDSAIRGFALRKWRHPMVTAEPLWRAIALIFTTWPFYTLAWIMALTRQSLAFKPTPKSAAASVNRWWLIPQLTTVGLIIWGLWVSIQVLQFDIVTHWLLYLVAIGFALPQIGLLRPLLRPIFVTPTEAQLVPAPKFNQTKPMPLVPEMAEEEF